MIAGWRRVWVVGLRTMPTTLAAGVVTTLTFSRAKHAVPGWLGFPAGMLGLLLIAALLGLDLDSPWGEAVVVSLGMAIGLLLGFCMGDAPLDEGIVLSTGVGLIGLAVIVGGIVSHRTPDALRPRWLMALVWIYLAGIILAPFLPALGTLGRGWAAAGLILFLLLTAAWAQTEGRPGQHGPPARSALQLYLMSINVILALTMLLSSGD